MGQHLGQISAICSIILLLGQAALAEPANEMVRLPVRTGPGFTMVTPEEAHVITGIKRSGNVFRNPRFWRYFSRHPERADERMRSWYGELPGFDRVLEKGQELGAHRVLLLDPGIVQHIDEFVDFARQKVAERPSITTFQLRHAFSKSLKPVTVWRGSWREPAQVATLEKRGVRANALSHHERAANAVLAYTLFGRTVYENPPNGPVEQIRRRLGGAFSASMYRSTSDYIEVTYAGAWGPPEWGGGKLGRGTFTLLKLKLSPLDVLKPSGIFEDLVQYRGQPMYYVTETFGGRPWSKRFDDPGFESFIQYAAPREIIEKHPYKTAPPTWRGEQR